MLLSECVKSWINARTLSRAPSTISGYNRLYRLYIVDTRVGGMVLDDLDGSDMIELLSPLIRRGCTRQAQLLQVLVSAALRQAVRKRLLTWSPMDEVEKVGHVSKLSAWLTVDQARQLLATSAAAGDPFYVAWLLMLCCGLRRGEMLGLRWSDIDRGRRLLHVERQKIEIDGEEFIAKDVNGNVVEPFIYNGTTYLPVRAIATAFDKDVAWDESTYTVKLNSKSATEDVPAVPQSKDAELIIGTWQCSVEMADFLETYLAEQGLEAEIESFPMNFDFIFDGTNVKLHFDVESFEPQMNSLVIEIAEPIVIEALKAEGITVADVEATFGVSWDEFYESVSDDMLANMDYSEFEEINNESSETYYLSDGIIYADGKADMTYYFVDENTLVIKPVEGSMTEENFALMQSMEIESLTLTRK